MLNMSENNINEQNYTDTTVTEASNSTDNANVKVDVAESVGAEQNGAVQSVPNQNQSGSSGKKRMGRPPKPRDPNKPETRGHKTTRQEAHERRVKEGIEHAALKGYRRPDLKKFAEENCLPGDNARAVEFVVELGLLPLVDLADAKAVESRVVEFFEICAKYDTKPLISGLADALGMDRRRLKELVNETPGRELGTTFESRASIKRAYNMMETLWEHYSVNGKMNPVTAIFMGKNNYGYQDKVELVATTQSKLVDADVESLVEEAKLLPTFTHETE